MEIQYQNIVPRPLEGIHNPDTQIWDKELTLEPGQFYEVKSPSGKGKSTFLHVLYGLRRDYRGTLVLNGKPAPQYTLEDWAVIRRSSMSIVFQDLRLFPELTGWENLVLKNSLTGYKTETQLRQMTETLGVDFLLNQKAGIMSYGQQQRMAIVRALCQPFELLLLDEPFSHLDQGNITLCSQLIADECKAQGAGLVLATLGENYPLPYTRHLLL